MGNFKRSSLILFLFSLAFVSYGQNQRFTSLTTTVGITNAGSLVSTGKVWLGSNVFMQLLSPSRVLIVDAAGNLTNATITIVELSRLSGLDSPIVTRTELSSSNFTFGIRMANDILNSLLQTTNPAVIKTLSGGANVTITDQGTNLVIAASGGAAGDSVLVDGANTTDPNFDDGGSINFQHSAGTITAYIKSGVVNNTNLADMVANTFKMRATGTGAPIDGTPAQALAALESGGVDLITSTELATPTIISFVNALHTHLDAANGGTLNASAIAAGTVATARLGSGTANSSTFLRGDNTWAAPGGSGAGFPLAADADANNFAIANLTTLHVKNGFLRGYTNISGVSPKLVMDGPGMSYWIPTNSTILDVVPLNSTNAVFHLMSITMTGAVHNQTISNTLAFGDEPIVLLPNRENLLLFMWDPVAQTNKVKSYQSLTNAVTGTGATVLSDSPSVTNATLVTPTIASFANAGHTHQNAAGGGTLDAAAIAAGTLGSARLGSGTADDNAFLRGDSTWVRSTTDGQVLRLAAGVLGFGALDLADSDAVTGSLPDASIPNNITIDLATLATTATTANSGDSATSFFPSGTIEDARLPATMDSKNLTASTAPTAPAGDQDTTLANTEFVRRIGNVPLLTILTNSYAEFNVFWNLATNKMQMLIATNDFTLIPTNMAAGQQSSLTIFNITATNITIAHTAGVRFFGSGVSNVVDAGKFMKIAADSITDSITNVSLATAKQKN